MKSTVDAEGRTTNPRDPPEGPPNPRPELHALIDTLPDAVLEPLRQLLLRAQHELMAPALILVLEMIQSWR